MIKDDEMPEIDFDKCKVIRRGPLHDYQYTLGILRESRGLTQTQLAKRAKISQSEVSRAELRTDCLVSTLQRYAVALGGKLCLQIEIDGRRYPVKLS